LEIGEEVVEKKEKEVNDGCKKVTCIFLARLRDEKEREKRK